MSFSMGKLRNKIVKEKEQKESNQQKIRKLRSIIKQEKSHIEPPTEDMHQVHGYNQTGVALSWNYYKYKGGEVPFVSD